MRTDATLLVLAAGMGSRYGGLKQIDTFGPNGETILDYSVYDAIQAGFKKVVFVIRDHFKKEIQSFFAGKFDDQIETVYVSQELDYIPDGFEVHPKREKPWGTAHAVAMAADVIDGPFCVINGDDFYGRDAYFILASYFESNSHSNNTDYALVAYDLVNTLSEHGTVNRGVCETDGEGNLSSIVETLKIGVNADRMITYPRDGQKAGILSPETPVSMNMWGFYPDYFAFYEASFKRFLKERGQELKSEFFIPLLVDHIIKSGQKQVAVLHSTASWFGVTYQEDKPFVMSRLNELIASGAYPSRLWE